MNYSEAHLMALTNDLIETTIIESNFPDNDKERKLIRNENVIQNKENYLQSTFYKNIGKIILNYDDVVLFGPTTAKNELFNILNAEHKYDEINIEIKSADKMTENEEHAFVKEFFYIH